MVFKRRDTRSWGRLFGEALWPRGGWVRAAQYVQHRMRRLPGTPEQIARGIFAGCIAIFTPFFGFHFFIAAGLAWLFRGSIIASLLATFLGNPFTYVPIAYLSVHLGHFLLGTTPRGEFDASITEKFTGAVGDLWHNFKAIFTDETAHWVELHRFYDDVFFPWMVGGILPGIICGAICYYLSVPLIRAYQKSRAVRLRKKMEKLRDQADVAE